MGEAQSIQWFPGHMTKTKRQMEKTLKLVDAVAEIVDARIPISSRNPVIDQIIQQKPRVILLNKADMADPAQTKRWIAFYRSKGILAMPIDCKSGKGIQNFIPLVKELLKDRIASWESKGMVCRTIRVMVVGVPNVGKSSLINRMSKQSKANVEDRPGVTRENRWFTIGKGFELLDTPGILWPKFEDETIGLHLAFTGAVRDAIMDVETLACHLILLLAQRKPEALTARFKIVPEEGMSGWDLLEAGARKRGFLISGGEVDLERMANILLDEFRAGKMGRITLELPEDLEREEDDHGTA